MDGEAAGFRPGEEVSADSRNPRRAVRYMYNVGFNYMWQNFAANEFVVLYANPRGSTGLRHGVLRRNRPQLSRARLRRSDGRRRRGDREGLRRIRRSMYVSGCSGGGVLSSWVIGHTDRFAAAAVRCPVIDWLSMAGHTDVPLVHLQLLQEAVLGRSQRLAVALLVMHGGQGDHADSVDDRRAGSPHADAADRGILFGAENARRAGNDCCSSKANITAPGRSLRISSARSFT